MDLENLLYPRTKFEVLKILYYADAPVPLREISYRSNLVVGSVQAALKILLKEKIISRANFNNRAYYKLSNLQVREALLKLIEVLEPFKLREQAKLMKRRAINILPQLEERNKIINRGRRSLKP